jgi:hypothetical protein
MNGVGTRARRKQREIPASTALVLFALGCSHSSPPPTTASGAGEADARERSSREGEVAMPPRGVTPLGVRSHFCSLLAGFVPRSPRPLQATGSKRPWKKRRVGGS